ncbi:MAG: histidine phosphatase family protein [Candidatus Liptonbacteria bacterium]|nr:histidine phosphatase family protein [Candidatus Liptonbacteria bacterium]
MITLIFIRHGESTGNRDNIIAGESTRLTTAGIQQAQKAAEKLLRQFDILVSSPFIRAVQTAKIIGDKTGHEIIIRDEIKEKSFGSFIGKPIDEVEAYRQKHQAERDLRLGYDYNSIGGESGRELAERISQFVTLMKENYPGQRILAVTHAAVIRLVHVLYGTKEYGTRLSVPNVSTHKFDLQ